MTDDYEKRFALFASSMTKAMRRVKALELDVRAIDNRRWMLERRIIELERRCNPDAPAGQDVPARDRASKPEASK